MNNKEIWDKFLQVNSKWREAEHSGEKIELTYYQLKNVIDTAAKYARMDEKEEIERKRVIQQKLEESMGYKKDQGDFTEVFSQMFGSGLGKK